MNHKTSVFKNKIRRCYHESMFDSWGVEFIDDGGYGQRIHAKSEEPDFTWLPLQLVKTACDETYLNQLLKNDNEYIYELASSISINGFREPTVLHYDTNNNVYLSDGNHRILASEILNLKHVPVILRQSDGIRSRCGKISDFLQGALEIIWQHQKD